MRELLPSTPPRPTLSGPLGSYLMGRLAELDARADRLARQAEDKGDLKTALTATRLSASILAQMARLAPKCAEALKNWQPPLLVGATTDSATPAGWSPKAQPGDGWGASPKSANPQAAGQESIAAL